jgi:serine/threonine protein kinase/formylglycine-generating enzyme required for sulfatase activity
VALAISRLEAGEADAISRICQEHPNLAASLAERVRSLQVLGLTESQVLPRRLGRYVLESVISVGGMGEVYRGSQVDPIRRTVAVKMIRAERMSERALDLFKRERQILADLKHPSIAKLFDASQTENGTPYFVMEFIEGEHLSAYCDRRKLSLRERLRLFLLVCDPLHHAHLRGVIHRDIKPSNILIESLESGPIVKVIDFGLGKIMESTRSLIDAPLGERAVPTGERITSPSTTRPGMGTRFYCSPEQRHGSQGDIDLRTDIYSLGAVLYQLLCGVHPNETSEQGVPSSSEESAPSACPEPELSRAAKHCGLPSADSLRRLLRGDLDAIVMRAMAVARDNRYSSVQLLAEDIQRHLDRVPVLARRAGLVLQTVRLIQRHRVVASLVSLLVIGLAIGLILLAGQKSDLEKSNASLETSLARYNVLEQIRSFAILLELESNECWSALGEERADLSAWVSEMSRHADALPSLEEQVRLGSSDGAGPPSGPLLHLLKVHRLAVEREATDAGAISLAKHRLAHGDIIRRASLIDAAPAWEKAADEVRAHKDYNGLELVPHEGLVPLGADPDSGLQEFAALIPGLEVPERNAAGNLVLDGPFTPVLVLIPEGDHVVGSNRNSDDPRGRDPDAEPECEPAKVVALLPFFIGKHEVTRAQYRAMTTTSPVVHQNSLDSRLPQVDISWLEANRAAVRSGLSLPFESEWEAATRAGTSSIWPTGSVPESLEGYVNCADQSLAVHRANPRGYAPFRDGFVEHAPVDSLKANAYGLHHTLGNVSELCMDM